FRVGVVHPCFFRVAAIALPKRVRGKSASEDCREGHPATTTHGSTPHGRGTRKSGKTNHLANPAFGLLELVTVSSCAPLITAKGLGSNSGSSTCQGDCTTIS